MLHKILFAIRYIKYFISARFYYGHGVHSPFLYRFVRSVLFTRRKNNNYRLVKKVLKAYKKNKNVVFINDFGAGSKTNASDSRTIRDIAINTSTRKKYGNILSRIVDYFNVENALELGTALGIGSLYIAGSGKVKLHTIEGDKSLYSVAKSTFEQLGLKNIITYHGTFENVLPGILDKINNLDLVYFDGNHTKEATLNYFKLCLNKVHNDSVFVFDDIHWSENMEQAWEEIRKHSKVEVSVDLFQMGIIFFRKELSKEHYIIRY